MEVVSRMGGTGGVMAVALRYFSIRTFLIVSKHTPPLRGTPFRKSSAGGRPGNDNNLCISIRTFLIVSKHTPPFEEHHWGSSPLSERGGCCITTIFATIGYILNSIVFLTRGYIEGEADASQQNTYQLVLFI